MYFYHGTSLGLCIIPFFNWKKKNKRTEKNMLEEQHRNETQRNHELKERTVENQPQISFPC